MTCCNVYLKFCSKTARMISIVLWVGTVSCIVLWLEPVRLYRYRYKIFQYFEEFFVILILF